ncbi:hypothetical protein ACFWA9_10320 [Kitasatospora sp. NPDC059973]|uniref:hypothetical protein n=1 Tax=Kitasatospora sp. NPDC059973 TaxID=3347020 RepID=UPI00368EF45F
MPERYIATFEEPPSEKFHSTPDFAADGWQFAAYSDLNPGPVGIVAVAATEEAGREQTDVILTIDPAAGCSVRARVWHKRARWEDDPEIPEVVEEFTDAEGLDQLRISAYGAWGRRGLAAALREAAEMLEAADRHLPQVD